MDYLKKGIVRNGGSLSLSERHQMIKEYLGGGYAKQEIWFKYTGQYEEHGGLLRWMRMYGYIDDDIKRRVSYRKPINSFSMADKYDDLDKPELQARIKELERLLQNSKLKEEGYRMMIETAEKTYKLPIRKKSNTK